MDACGHCPACLKLSNENHPDLMWVSPDGASIRIDQAREIAAATRYRPNEGRWRVIVIDECEKMGEAAANALLKTIEEPGGQTLFLLLTRSEERRVGKECCYSGGMIYTNRIDFSRSD